jgi:hypothetical protein
VSPMDLSGAGIISSSKKFGGPPFWGQAPSRGHLGIIAESSRNHRGIISESSRNHLGIISASSRNHLGTISQSSRGGAEPVLVTRTFFGPVIDFFEQNLPAADMSIGFIWIRSTAKLSSTLFFETARGGKSPPPPLPSAAGPERSRDLISVDLDKSRWISINLDK